MHPHADVDCTDKVDALSASMAPKASFQSAGGFSAIPIFGERAMDTESLDYPELTHSPFSERYRLSLPQSPSIHVSGDDNIAVETAYSLGPQYTGSATALGPPTLTTSSTNTISSPPRHTTESPDSADISSLSYHVDSGFRFYTAPERCAFPQDIVDIPPAYTKD